MKEKNTYLKITLKIFLWFHSPVNSYTSAVIDLTFNLSINSKEISFGGNNKEK